MTLEAILRSSECWINILDTLCLVTLLNPGTVGHMSYDWVGMPILLACQKWTSLQMSQASTTEEHSSLDNVVLEWLTCNVYETSYRPTNRFLLNVPQSYPRRSPLSKSLEALTAMKRKMLTTCPYNKDELHASFHYVLIIDDKELVFVSWNRHHLTT